MITGPRELRRLVKTLLRRRSVALDTEFVWERTFYARLGVVQVGLDNGECFLIDAVRLNDLDPLAELLASKRVTKILHDAPQDLMILKQATGTLARSVFDTRIAAGFVGLSSEISLQALLQTVLGIDLPKEHTRTNWTARPLSRAQVEYAANDVRHLLKVEDSLRRKARKADVEAWLEEEMAGIDDVVRSMDCEPEAYYARIRAAQSMAPRKLAVLRELAAWRETQARKINVPRGRIAKDVELVCVAHALPRTPEDLSACRRLGPRTARRYGKALLAAVARGQGMGEGKLPARLTLRSLKKVTKEQINAAYGQVERLACSKDIDPRLVCSKSELSMLLREGPGAGPDDHAMLSGWRAELLKEALDGFFEGPPGKAGSSKLSTSRA